jgi:hypothetical protein
MWVAEEKIMQITKEGGSINRRKENNKMFVPLTPEAVGGRGVLHNP